MKIEIRCEGKTAISYQYLKPFQENLKDLTQINYKRLKGRIIELGFSEPISVWIHKTTHYILNGHQRLRTIQKMVTEEGYECPDLPINLVQAKNFKQAKEKVLALASQYGEVNDQGLYEFLESNEIDYNKLNEEVRFPEINSQSFISNFYEDPRVVGTDPNGEWDGMPEFDHEDKKSVRDIVMHFKSEEDIKAFAELLKQMITDKTKFLWYPKMEIERYVDKSYES